jgi:hypothetical protein
MSKRHRLLQVGAAASILTAHLSAPRIAAADPVNCTEYCANSCGDNICDRGCTAVLCVHEACNGVDGNTYIWDVTCA